MYGNIFDAIMHQKGCTTTIRGGHEITKLYLKKKASGSFRHEMKSRRQANSEGGPAFSRADTATNADCSTVSLNKFPGKSQPQPGPSIRLGGKEWFEN